VSEVLKSVRSRLTRRWEGRGSPAAARALAGGYRGLLETREWLYRHRVLKSRSLPCVVVSIGNLTVGGTGKTPAVEHAVRTLAGLGARPAIVSRGYGRQSKGIRVVADGDSILLDAREAGDEPFLLARHLPGVPVIVGANRYEAARLALRRFGVSAVVLDDGFQHRSLAKDVEIVLVRAAANPWGNGCLFPAGPLREPLEALSRANLIIASGGPEREEILKVAAVASRYAPGVPVLAAGYEPVDCWLAGDMARTPARSLAGKRLVGFAGIAWPEGFRRTLEALGVALAGFEAFPDHFWYQRHDLNRLSALARAAGADGLVTTEKDWVRLQALPLPVAPLYALGVRFLLHSGEAVFRDILARVRR